MAVYRMKFAPDVMVAEFAKGTELYDSCRAEIFEKLTQYNFIGTGWAEVPLQQGMSDEEIREASGTPKGSIENFKNICAIGKDDLIWIIHNSKYYLFKVSESQVGTNWLKTTFGKDEKWFLDRDIAKCFTGKWLEIGNEVNVPGIVINNMGIGGTLRELKRAPWLSEMVWNNASHTNTFEIGYLTEDDFWDLLTDRQVEGIVMSYLQVTYDCIVNTESLKHSTALYECELITKDGIHYYPQVKTGASGNKEFPVEKYCAEIRKIAKETSYASVPVVFYENEDYGNYEEQGLVKIYRRDLMKFIQNNENYISKSVLQAYELIKQK